MSITFKAPEIPLKAKHYHYCAMFFLMLTCETNELKYSKENMPMFIEYTENFSVELAKSQIKF